MSIAAAPAHLRASLAQVADLGQLTAAWDDILASDRDDGILGSGVARFAKDARQNLAEMAAQLPAGGYRPGHLASVSLPRADGQVRLLHVPGYGTGSSSGPSWPCSARSSTRGSDRSATPTVPAWAWPMPCRR